MSYQKLFSLHGELGYFDLFDSQFQLPLLILGPRGFGKSELFSLFIEQFNDDYIKFIRYGEYFIKKNAPMRTRIIL